MRKISMIPYPEMPQILKVCTEVSKTALQEHQWVRVKSGVYAGDLGLVEMIEGGYQKAIVKLIPRIETTKSVEGKPQLKLATKFNKDQKKSDLIRVP